MLTYTPLALFSLWSQCKLGVDAIRTIDSSWDEHRGPLYPSLMYKMFNLYEPNYAEPRRAIVESDNADMFSL